MGGSGQDVLGPPFLYAPEECAVSFIWKVNGTIIPLVLSSPLFWFLMLAHGGFLLVFKYFDEPYLEWRAALVPSSLLTFLLVTFVNQCFERYFTLYKHCVGLHGSVMEWSALVKLEFGHMSSNYKWNVLRLLLSALQARVPSCHAHTLLMHAHIQALHARLHCAPAFAGALCAARRRQRDG